MGAAAGAVLALSGKTAPPTIEQAVAIPISGIELHDVSVEPPMIYVPIASAECAIELRSGPYPICLDVLSPSRWLDVQALLDRLNL